MWLRLAKQRSTRGIGAELFPLQLHQTCYLDNTSPFLTASLPEPHLAYFICLADYLELPSARLVRHISDLSSGLHSLGVQPQNRRSCRGYHISLKCLGDTLSIMARQEKRTQNSQNQRLERSLERGETKAQEEYNAHFARLGRSFAVGNGRQPPNGDPKDYNW